MENAFNHNLDVELHDEPNMKRWYFAIFKKGPGRLFVETEEGGRGANGDCDRQRHQD